MINSLVTAFPSRSLPADMKDAGYTVAFGEAMLAYYSSPTANPYINQTRVDEFEVLESYAQGNQSQEYCKNYFAESIDPVTKQRRGTQDLVFTIFPFAPLILNSSIEILNRRSAELNVSFLDQVSSFDKKLKKAEIWFDNNDGQFFNQQLQQLGLDAKEPEVRVKSKQELDLYEAEGGIKLSYEIAFEEALNYIFNYDNKWKNYMSPKLKENLITLGVAGGYQYINPVTKKIESRDIDPKRCILPNSKYYNYKDAAFFGEIVSLPVLDILKGIENTTGVRLTEKELDDLVSSNGSNLVNGTNPNIPDKYYDNIDWYASPKYSGAQLSNVYKEVLDFVYLSEDIVDSPVKPKVKVRIKPEIVKPNEIETGKILKDDSGYYKEVETTSTDKLKIMVWRRGKLVIGTKIAYDYGLCYDQTKNAEGDPQKPFFVVRTPTDSIMKIIRPNLDAIQLIHMILQNEVLKSHGRSIHVDVEALGDVVLGGKNYDPKELLKLYRLENVLFYRTAKSGLPNGRNNPEPIREVDGGIGSYLNELMTLMAFHINIIKQNTGLNDMALASNPNPEVTLGQSQMAMGAANNAISNIYNAYVQIKEDMAYNSLLYLQKLALEEPKSVYLEMLGKTTWDSIKEAAKKDLRNVAMTVREMPTQDEINEINRMIEVALAGGKNGNAQLTPVEALQLKKMLKEGTSTSLVIMILQSKIDAREQKSQEYAQQAMAQQGQQNQELAAQQSQAKLQELQAEETIKYQAASKLQQEKYAFEERLKALDDNKTSTT